MLGLTLRERSRAMLTNSPTPFSSIVLKGSDSNTSISKYVGRNLTASSRLKAYVIWVKSLVPKLKKSAYWANSAARSAARGTSIIEPTLMCVAALSSPSKTFAITASTRVLKIFNSFAEQTIGIIISGCTGTFSAKHAFAARAIASTCIS